MLGRLQMMKKHACDIICRQRSQGKGFIAVCQIFFLKKFLFSCLFFVGLVGFFLFGSFFVVAFWFCLFVCFLRSVGLFWRQVHRSELLKHFWKTSAKNWKLLNFQAWWSVVEQGSAELEHPHQPVSTLGTGGCRKVVIILLVLPAAEVHKKMTDYLTLRLSPCVSSFPQYARSFLSPHSAGKHAGVIICLLSSVKII